MMLSSFHVWVKPNAKAFFFFTIAPEPLPSGERPKEKRHQCANE